MLLFLSQQLQQPEFVKIVVMKYSMLVFVTFGKMLVDAAATLTVNGWKKTATWPVDTALANLVRINA